jgi:hypothetical protein
VYISFPLWSKISWLCACIILTERNKEEELVDVAPRVGVNHVYPVLWFLCALWLFSCLCD